MAVTAKFVPEQIDLLPNVPTTLTLRLYNGDAVTRETTVVTSGDLAAHTEIDAAAASLAPNQILDVSVRIDVPSSVEAGIYSIAAEVTCPNEMMLVDAPVGPPVTGDDSYADTGVGVGVDTSHAATTSNTVIASVTVHVVSHSDHSIELQPVRSRGSSGGRHLVRVINTGNVVVMLQLSIETLGDGVGAEVGPSELMVPPGATGEATVRITPATTRWSGQHDEHEFIVRAHSADGRDDEMVGIFEQRPRVPNWLGPAAAGALAAVLIGTIAWFALLRPWIEDYADQAAADAIEQDRAALRERIADLEAAAANAKELPLGSPVDFRLEVAPTGGNSDSDAAIVKAGTIVSITDVVFQNPSGAVGTVSLRRGDEVLLQSELANFRDFDLHFVAPLTFDEDAKIVVEVECRTPGSGESDCPVGVSLVGFVDEVT